MDEIKPILIKPEPFVDCLSSRGESQSEKKCDMMLSLNRPDEQKTSEKYIGKNDETVQNWSPHNRRKRNLYTSFLSLFSQMKRQHQPLDLLEIAKNLDYSMILNM